MTIIRGKDVVNTLGDIEFYVVSATLAKEFRQDLKEEVTRQGLLSGTSKKVLDKYLNYFYAWSLMGMKNSFFQELNRLTGLSSQYQVKALIPTFERYQYVLSNNLSTCGQRVVLSHGASLSSLISLDSQMVSFTLKLSPNSPEVVGQIPLEVVWSSANISSKAKVDAFLTEVRYALPKGYKALGGVVAGMLLESVSTQ